MAQSTEAKIASLCTLLTTHQYTECATLLSQHVRSLQDTPSSDAYEYTCSACHQLIITSSSPIHDTLQLIIQPSLIRQARDKVDILTTLLQSLQMYLEEHDDIIIITDKERDIAQRICTDGTTSLSSRSYDLLLRIFSLTLTPSDHLSYVHSLTSRHSYRDVADTTIKYGLYSYIDNQNLIINLLRLRLIDVLTTYVKSIPREIPAKVGTMSIENGASTSASTSTSTSVSTASTTATPTSTDTLPPPTSLYSQCISYAVHLVANGYDNIRGDINAAMRLVSRWGHEMTEFPRLMYLKEKDAVWWTVSFCKTDDYIDELVEDDVKLQTYLCRQLLKNKYQGDKERAYRYIHKYHLETEAEFQPFLQEYQSTSTSTSTTPSADSSTSASSTFPSSLPILTLPLESIVFVNSHDTLDDARRYLLDPSVTIIGLDVERLPDNFDGIWSFPSCQTLQIACPARSFIFDLQILYEHPMSWYRQHDREMQQKAITGITTSTTTSTSTSTPSSQPESITSLASSMEKLLMDLFDNDGAIKVGIGFSSDMQLLHRSFPTRAAFQVSIQNYVELTPALKMWDENGQEEAEDDGENGDGEDGKEEETKTVSVPVTNGKDKKKWKKGRKGGRGGPKIRVPLPDDGSSSALKEGGLARLVRMCLGCTLDKSQQLSNWTRRPLTSAQLHYAALDAHCQIAIYEKCIKRRLHLPADSLELS